MQPNAVTLLALTDFFDNLDKTQLDLVASVSEPLIFDKGHVLFEENDSTDDMYVIGRGGVEIDVNPGFVGATEEEQNTAPVTLVELRQGQVVGEVALVDQGIRSATARISRDDTFLLRIQRERLMKLCNTYPELGYKIMKNLAADLSLKMRHTDLAVRQYQLLLSKSNAA